MQTTQYNPNLQPQMSILVELIGIIVNISHIKQT